MKAIWQGKVLAESDITVIVEANHYFPMDTVDLEFFSESDKHTVCPWKGRASYYNMEVDGEMNANAAWYYPDPGDAALEIADHVAFWGGVQIVE